MHISTYVCAYVSLYAHMYNFLMIEYVCVQMHICKHLYRPRSFLEAGFRPRIHPFVFICTVSSKLTSFRICVFVCKCTYVHSCVCISHLCVCVQMHTCKTPNTHRSLELYIHIYIYICSHIYICLTTYKLISDIRKNSSWMPASVFAKNHNSKINKPLLTLDYYALVYSQSM